MLVKIHKSYRTVIAICDSDLIGKKFHEGKKQLDLRENFYKGKNMSYDKVVKLMKFQSKKDATFNIVGTESIKAAEEAGIISKNSSLEISGIPYNLVLI